MKLQRMGRTKVKIIEQSARILWPTQREGIDAQKRIEYAGRNCYLSQDKITEESYGPFIRGLIKRGHESPLEHSFMTVEVVTSRAVMAELTRHRLASFSIQSQRYVMDNRSGEISFIKPDYWLPELPPSMDAKMWCASRAWERCMERVEEDYKYLVVVCSLPPQDARKILPNSTAVKIVMTANIREWIHIFDLRDSTAAYPEMQTLMSKLVPLAREVYPIVFDSVGKDRHD